MGKERGEEEEERGKEEEATDAGEKENFLYGLKLKVPKMNDAKQPR